MNYEEQANRFAKKHGVELSILEMKHGKHFPEDRQERYIFKCRLARNGEKYIFDFGQSIVNGSKSPTMYDILSCMEKYDVGSFKDFCDEFGYEADSPATERVYRKVYKAVCREYEAMERLFGDVMDELREIN